MSNGKLLTLFLDHENELRATMPDFAHQLSELLQVPPKVVDYSKKAVAEYEIAETELENTNQESEEESEKEFEFHEDFEKNIMFLMDKNDESMMSVFKNHFEGDENRETMMAQLADNFSLENLQSFFEPAGQNTTKPPKGKGKTKEKSTKRKTKGFFETIGDAIFREEGKPQVQDDLLSTYINHCGVDPKKKKKSGLIEIKFCESCDAEHADHFRLCDLCNEEHDGCCEVYA